jgi:uncharacterized protein (TIGR03000 family)
MYSVVLAMALAGSGEVTNGFGGHGCHGCSGCYSGCSGCYSSCHGCHSRHGHHRCHGCSSCYSTCYGCSGYGCYGSGYGCYGSGYGCYGSGYGCYGAPPMTPPGPPPADKGGKPMPPPVDKGGKPGTTSIEPAPATIIVNLPADAKLMFDDYATTSTSNVRTFQTPTLPMGKDFTYTLKAQLMVEGKPMTQTEKITVRAGEETKVMFSFPNTVAAK